MDERISGITRLMRSRFTIFCRREGKSFGCQRIALWLCDDFDAPADPASDAATYFFDHGWRAQPGGGLFCPSCVKIFGGHPEHFQSTTQGSEA